MPKTLFLIALSLIVCSICYAGEIVNLKCLNGTATSEELVLQQGESAKFIHLVKNDSTPSYFEVKFPESGDQWLAFSPVYDLTNLTIAGPASIRLRKSQAIANTFASFEVERKEVEVEEPNPPEVIPVASVVIPEDVNGQFQVILESSTDTITWTQAQPGTYGGSTEKRFFRTRIIRTN